MRRRQPREDPDVEQTIPPALLVFDPRDWAEWADIPLVDDDELEHATPYSGRPASTEVRIAEMPHLEDRHLHRAAYRWSESRRVWADEHGWPTDGVDRLIDEHQQVEAWAHTRPAS